MKSRTLASVVLALLLLAALLPSNADKTVVYLLNGVTATGRGALRVSSAVGSVYVFQLVAGTADVSIDVSVDGGSWKSVGVLKTVGDLVTVPACGPCSFSANVVNVYSTVPIVVASGASGAPVMTVLTPTATPTVTPTPTPTLTPTVTPTHT